MDIYMIHVITLYNWYATKATKGSFHVMPCDSGFHLDVASKRASERTRIRAIDSSNFDGGTMRTNFFAVGRTTTKYKLIR